MSFLAPFLLWGSLAAGVPVVIHFFFRARHRTVYWAAMSFLRQSIEQTSRRLRFQELLLLLLRVLMLLLLALALARPTTRAILSTTGSDAVDAVLLFDTSLSMDGKEGIMARLDRAKAAGKTVLSHLPSNSTAQVIVCSDRATLLGPRRFSDLDQAMAIIEGIGVTARGSDLAPGFHDANEALRRGWSPQRELYVFTDGQARAFDQQPAAVAEAAKACKQVASIYLCHCGKELIRNATLTSIAPQTGLPHTGERVGFAVLVKNTGQEPLRDLTVSLTPDGDDRRRETQPLPRLDAGETRAISLTARWSDPGLHTVTARVQSDDLAADDRCDRVIRVRDRVRVLVVDGSPNDRDPEKASTFFLLHALLPVKDVEKAKYYLQPRLVSPARVSPQMLTDHDICILANVAVERDAAKPGEVLPPEFVTGLDRFVREGKTLIVFAGDRVKPDAYAKVLLDRWPLLPIRPIAVRTYAEQTEVGIDRASLTDPAFAKFRDDDTYQTFGQVKTRRLIEGTELLAEEGRGPTRVLMRASDGKPLLASRSVGAGTVAMMTTSADVSWTDLPLWVNAYVPLVDALMANLLLAETDAHNANARTGIKWNVPAADAERPYVMVRPDGLRVRLGLPEPVQGRPRISAPDTPFAGLYRLQPSDAPDSAGVPFAVTFDPDEATNPELLSDDRINERLGFAPVHLHVADDLSPFQGAERSKQEWTPKLLWLLLLAALGETAFACFVSKPK
jgi:Aerotolerance regulator N-terminal/von Willebrand factor type A domain/CARDB